MEITTSSPDYLRGDELIVQTVLKAEGKYDVFYAVILPGGDFITLREDETISTLNEILPYKVGMVINGMRSERVLTIPVLPDLTPGEYMILGVIVKNGENIFAHDAIIATGSAMFQFFAFPVLSDGGSSAGALN